MNSIQTVNFYLCRRLLRIALSITVVTVAAFSNADLIFNETFNSQPDYTSSETLNLDGWSVKRHGEDVFNPDTGYPNSHDAFEVHSKNSDKARMPSSSSDKSFVGWRESYDLGWKNFNSDGILAKLIPGGRDQLYVSFWVSFSPDWTHGGLSKLFRIYSWDETSDQYFKFFTGGNGGPILNWDYSNGAYGVRNFLALRGGPHGENYEFRNADIAGLPRQIGGIGDISLNFTGDTVGMGPNGSTPQIVDKVNGGYISDDLNQTVQHEQIFGPGGTWTKVAFFVKMNSAPNVADGELVQWIDDELVFRSSSIPWVRGTDTTEMVKWNVVGLGGNDFFRAYGNDAQHEEWYSIDDVQIHDSIPNAPMPPVDATRVIH